ITNNNADDLAPIWSRNGTQLYFYSDKSGGREVYVYDLNSQTETVLTSNDLYDGLPEPSPDGTRVVFGSTRSTSSDLADLFVMDINGTNVQQITDDPATDDNATWSLDGSEIAFESGRSGDFDIWLMD